MAISTRSAFSSSLDFNFRKENQLKQKKTEQKKIADIGPKKGVEVGSGTVFINWFIFNMNVHIFAPFDVSQLFVRKDNDTFLETLWIYLYFRSFGTPLLLLVASAERSYIAFKNVTFCNTYIVHLLRIPMKASTLALFIFSFEKLVKCL